jgi:hypothetical protein
MGEAAATAAHLALAGGADPADIDVSRLQQTLERNGVFLGKETS